MLSPDSSLTEVRAFIAQVAADLDPQSRYISELLAIVTAARDTRDLMERLLADCRGARHAGRAVFEAMSVEDRLRCNLVTNETVLFRFSEGEWEVLLRLVTRPRAAPVRVLSAPCSHGEEAFSIAAACLKAGVRFSIEARDIQQACVEAARTGRLTMGFPDEYLSTPAVVAAPVLAHIDFGLGDLLVAPGAPSGVAAGPWDLVVCRNFLGYFVEGVATRIAMGLGDRVSPGGALFVDSFCLSKFPGLELALAGRGLRRSAGSPVFLRG